MSKSRIVIGDVHGDYDTLMALMAQLPTGVPVTFCGDLIDRGPKSAEVVEYVKNSGHDCVMGNHEDMMTNDLKFTDKGVEVDMYHSNWYAWNGGMQTLASYENHPDEVLKEHYEWMKTLPTHIEYPEVKDANNNHLLVSHSTAEEVWHWKDLPEGTMQKQQFKTRIMWDRNNFPAKIPGIYNIYGHTPQRHGPTIKEHFACVDTGVYLRSRAEYGRLTAVQFPEMIIYTQTVVKNDP